MGEPRLMPNDKVIPAPDNDYAVGIMVMHSDDKVIPAPEAEPKRVTVTVTVTVVVTVVGTVVVTVTVTVPVT